MTAHFHFFRKAWPMFLILVGLIEIIVLAFFHETMPLNQELQIGMSLALILHIFEEEFFPGGFGFAFNTVRNPDDYSDYYPMNPLISMVVNFLGLIFVTIPAFFPSFCFLGIGISFFWMFETVLHTVLSIAPISKGIPFYSPGVVTAWVCGCFCAVSYLRLIISAQLVSAGSWAGGIAYLLLIIIFCIRIPENRLASKESLVRYKDDRDFYGFFYRYIKNRYGIH